MKLLFILLNCLMCAKLGFSLEEKPEISPAFVAWRDTQFHLYTRSNPTTWQTLELYGTASITNSNFKASRPTRYILHGFQNNGKSEVNIKLRDAYLAKGDFNVITVDWGKGASTLSYDEARHRTADVADTVAEFIEILKTDHGQQLSNVQLVGHSLGAHIAGMTGKKVQQLKLGTIPKIVGLDPAMPGFGNPSVTLQPSDATFVEVIHTNSRMLGYDKPLGHVDHYPNYGFTQPGCGIDAAGTCAHGRSFQYFAESITSTKQFSGYKCSDYYAIEDKKCQATGTKYKMGGEPLTTSTPRGIYYVPTNSASPFAI